MDNIEPEPTEAEAAEAVADGIPLGTTIEKEFEGADGQTVWEEAVVKRYAQNSGGYLLEYRDGMQERVDLRHDDVVWRLVDIGA